jgi:hypothetical protein
MNEGNDVDNDDGIGNPANYYEDEDEEEEEEEEEEFGHEASGTSPAAIEYEEKQTRDDQAAMEAVMNGGNNLVQAVAQAIHVSADPLPIRAGEWQSSGAAPQMIAGKFSPPKMRSSLHLTSFAPVVLNPMPTIDDAVDVDPDFFEGAHQAGSGPGPHFITVSFIKNKDKI